MRDLPANLLIWSPGNLSNNPLALPWFLHFYPSSFLMRTHSSITFLTQDERRRLFDVITTKRDRALFRTAYSYRVRFLPKEFALFLPHDRAELTKMVELLSARMYNPATAGWRSMSGYHGRKEAEDVRGLAHHQGNHSAHGDVRAHAL